MQKTFTLGLPHRLKELRSGRSQADMAKELHVNQQTYARWELGDRQPKLQDLCAIALHFGVTSDWLLGLDEVSPENSTNWKEKYLGATHQLSRVNKALDFILKGAGELQSILEDGGRK